MRVCVSTRVRACRYQVLKAELAVFWLGDVRHLVVVHDIEPKGPRGEDSLEEAALRRIQEPHRTRVGGSGGAVRGGGGGGGEELRGLFGEQGQELGAHNINPLACGPRLCRDVWEVRVEVVPDGPLVGGVGLIDVHAGQAYAAWAPLGP